MASFGRISNSLVTGVNESTLALANLNFDFAVVKIQAPEEYMPVGNALGVRRRESAEYGATHRTARKLAALFEPVVLDAPGLVAAYGRRASQIMETPGANPSGRKEKHGPFASFVGADATSIWAAATSGGSAIAVHLLACLLAKSFGEPAQATSIWAELVTERQQEILKSAQSPVMNMSQIAAMNAANQTITREELRQWDASARAWLQTADSVMNKQHIQLRLILNNISLPVAGGANLYADVVRAWNQAMIGMECLLKGEPQSVTDGAILLAISAWHLYPNLLVLGRQTTNVIFNDCLLQPGGVLTVGLTTEGRTATQRTGIYWSVALSHYRYYGHPAKAVGSMSDRLTIDELHLVALGSLLSSWNAARSEFELSAQWFVALKACVCRVKTLLKCPSWLENIASAAACLLDLKGAAKEESMRLVDFGYRRGRNFLLPRSKSAPGLPWFGLRCRHIISSLCRDSAGECIIEYLRQSAQAGGLDNTEALIVVAENSGPTKAARQIHCTVVPQDTVTLRPWTETPVPLMDDVPPLYEESNILGSGKQRQESILVEHVERSYERTFPRTGAYFDERLNCTRVHPVGKRILASCDAVLPKARFKNVLTGSNDATRLYVTQLSEKREGHFEAAVKRLRLGLGSPLFDMKESIEILKEPYTMTGLSFERERATQNPGLARELETQEGIELRLRQIREQILFHPASKGYDLDDYDSSFGLGPAGGPERISACPDNEPIKGKEEMITPTALNPLLLWQYLEGPDPYDPEDLIKPALEFMRTERELCRTTINSLRSLALVKTIYKDLSGATISASVVSKGIYDARWGATGRDTFLTRSMVFSCLAMMETGSVNMDTDKLDHVFALSAGNSLFVASRLLSDPCAAVADHSVTRIVGSVGRPGISLLIPPATGALLRALSSSYRAVTYAPFDGKREDNFKGTSLHLSFTSHEFPLDYGPSGIVDHQVFLVESVISVHDAGEWVADLDVMRAFDLSKAHGVLRRPRCSHDYTKARHADGDMVAALNSFTSVDSWEEVLDTPPGIGLVRAEKNWPARLAAWLLLSRKSDGSLEPDMVDTEDSEESDADIYEDSTGKAAILESGGSDVCWVCVHRRLCKLVGGNADSTVYLIL